MATQLVLVESRERFIHIPDRLVHFYFGLFIFPTCIRIFFIVFSTLFTIFVTVAFVTIIIVLFRAPFCKNIHVKVAPVLEFFFLLLKGHI